MEKREIGKFYAKRFDGIVYEFVVNDDKTMSCPELCKESITKLIIQPRFWLFCENNSCVRPAQIGVQDNLIKEYDIDDELFEYLKAQRMIRYSTDMAYLYGFNDKNGFDADKKGGRPFKWAEKKGPVLVKQKKGFYN